MFARCLRTGRRSLSTQAAVTPAKQIIFSGIQPTGVPHLGNYLGALKNWVRLQQTVDKEAKVFFSIVDLHAITVPVSPTDLRRDRDEMWYSLHAVGIDMERCIVFEQSAVPEHVELYWILGTLAPMGLLNSMTQWKAKLEQVQAKGLVPRPDDEISSEFGGARLGLFAYPVLQAADILLYNATHVPVGSDQSQHLETTRILAHNFNRKFDSSPQTFNIPETLISSFPRIGNLRDPTKKMSKSDPSNFTRIHITTPPSEIDLLFQKAASDSLRGMYTSPDRPGITNLFQILSAFEDTPIATLEQEFRGMERWWSATALKERTAKAVIRGLEPVRERYEQVRGDKKWLERVRRKGNERAREVARGRIKKIKEIVGLTHD